MKLRTHRKAAVNRDMKIPISSNSLFTFSPIAGVGILRFQIQPKLSSKFQYQLNEEQ